MAELPQFPGQKPDELVRLLVRPHWLVMLRPTVAIVFLAIIPIVVLAVLSANAVEISTGLGLAIAAVTVPAYYLMLVTWFFISWVDYYLDVGIITDQRIIDIDQRGLFQRNVAELECKMVQDINADKTGIMQTFFNFGDVIVQTAGERPNFRFHAVPKPEAMVDRIREVTHADSAKSEGAAEKMQEAASKMGKAAEKIAEVETGQTTGPTAPNPPQSAERQPEQPPAASQPQDELPREYER